MRMFAALGRALGHAQEICLLDVPPRASSVVIYFHCSLLYSSPSSTLGARPAQHDRLEPDSLRPAI